MKAMSGISRIAGRVFPGALLGRGRGRIPAARHVRVKA